jgi:hypothetical protein
MTSSTARTGPRHRAPSRWCHLQSEGEGEVVTVAQLLDRNQRLLFNYRLAQYRREHAGQPRRVAVVPRQRTTAD